MNTFQTIKRSGSFDSGHRVMNERFKCFNCHGHTYLYLLKFAFDSSADIGYAIDFKEVKRIGAQWIDDLLDHGMILNPEDKKLISTVRELDSKVWLMSLNGKDKYCNPSVENIAKELFLAQQILFEPYKNLWIYSVEIHETPNCATECFKESITEEEKNNFYETNLESIGKYAQDKGVLEYDDRQLNQRS